MKLTLALIVAAVLALAVAAQQAPPATPPKDAHKIDAEYLTAVQAVWAQAQENIAKIQDAANASLKKMRSLQCAEAKIKESECSLDWAQGVYWYQLAVKPPGTNK